MLTLELMMTSRTVAPVPVPRLNMWTPSLPAPKMWSTAWNVDSNDDLDDNYWFSWCWWWWWWWWWLLKPWHVLQPSPWHEHSLDPQCRPESCNRPHIPRSALVGLLPPVTFYDCDDHDANDANDVNDGDDDDCNCSLCTEICSIRPIATCIIEWLWW